MKTRLSIFVAALLLLPYAGLLLSEGEWSVVTGAGISTAGIAPGVIALLSVLCLTLLTNLLVTLRSRSNPFSLQRNYFLVVAAASSVLGWLLVLLNHYSASWVTAQPLDTFGIIVQTLLFALLAPAVLSTRALLGSFSGLLKRLSNLLRLPAPAPDTVAYTLAPIAMLGLIGGAAWPAQLFWLMWLAPLLLLMALQLLWHENTIFSSVPHGDWGRLICTALAGLLVGNLAVFAFQQAGGILSLQLPNVLFAQLGYAVFGLLCLQLGDAIAEQWRGKTRAQVFKKKPFPVPVVVKK